MEAFLDKHLKIDIEEGRASLVVPGEIPREGDGGLSRRSRGQGRLVPEGISLEEVLQPVEGHLGGRGRGDRKMKGREGKGF